MSAQPAPIDANASAMLCCGARTSTIKIWMPSTTSTSVRPEIGGSASR